MQACHKRSNCTPQLSPKNLQLQSLRFGAMKAQCSQACFCACKSWKKKWEAISFQKTYINHIHYIFISYYIIFILYTSNFITDRLDYLRHASRVSRIGSLKPIKHNSRTPAFCDRRFFHSRDRQASGREFAALKLSSPPQKKRWCLKKPSHFLWGPTSLQGFFFLWVSLRFMKWHKNVQTKFRPPEIHLTRRPSSRHNLPASLQICKVIRVKNLTIFLWQICSHRGLGVCVSR